MNSKITYDIWYIKNRDGKAINYLLTGPFIDLNVAYKKMEQYRKEDIKDNLIKRDYEIREHIELQMKE